MSDEKACGEAPLKETASQKAAQENASSAPQEPQETAPKEEKQVSTPSAPEVAGEAINWKDRYTRTLADFDNFRKRTARDREDLVKFASQDVLKDVLTTVDHLALALEKAVHAEDPFVVGVKLVYDGLLKTLSDHGATPLDSVGEEFNTNYHEALAQIHSPTVPEGHIVSEVKRGWLLHGKLLRAAQVIVSSGKEG